MTEHYEQAQDNSCFWLTLELRSWTAPRLWSLGLWRLGAGLVDNKMPPSKEELHPTPDAHTVDTDSLWLHFEQEWLAYAC